MIRDILFCPVCLLSSFTLAIPFEPKVIETSYLTCILHYWNLFKWLQGWLRTNLKCDINAEKHLIWTFCWQWHSVSLTLPCCKWIFLCIYYLVEIQSKTIVHVFVFVYHIHQIMYIYEAVLVPNLSENVLFLSRSNEKLSRSNEKLSRSNEKVSRSNEKLSRSNEKTISF